MINESNSTTTSTKFGNSSRDVNGEGDNNSVQLDAGLEHKLDSKGQILSASGSFQKPKTIILRTLPITISQV